MDSALHSFHKHKAVKSVSADDLDSKQKRLTALIVGLLLNAFGNGLTISTNVGTAPWGASEVNLAHILHTSIGLSMFMVGVLVACVNQLLIHRFDFPRFAGEIVFISFFSYFVNIFTVVFTKLGIANLPLVFRYVICFLGIIILCCSISFYQRANLIMHPNDDTTNILRFMYCHNKVIRAQLLNFLVPVIVMTVCFFLTHHLYAVNVGTVICLFANGPLIAFADKHLWHSLHHNIKKPHHITDRNN